MIERHAVNRSLINQRGRKRNPMRWVHTLDGWTLELAAIIIMILARVVLTMRWLVRYIWGLTGPVIKYIGKSSTTTTKTLHRIPSYVSMLTHHDSRETCDSSSQTISSRTTFRSKRAIPVTEAGRSNLCYVSLTVPMFQDYANSRIGNHMSCVCVWKPQCAFHLCALYATGSRSKPRSGEFYNLIARNVGGLTRGLAYKPLSANQNLTWQVGVKSDYSISSSRLGASFILFSIWMNSYIPLHKWCFRHAE